MTFWDLAHYTDLKACSSFIFYARSFLFWGMALHGYNVKNMHHLQIFRFCRKVPFVSRRPMYAPPFCFGENYHNIKWQIKHLFLPISKKSCIRHWNLYLRHFDFDHVPDYVTRTHYPGSDFHFRTLFFPTQFIDSWVGNKKIKRELSCIVSNCSYIACAADWLMILVNTMYLFSTVYFELLKIRVSEK